jgi:CMP-N-acetylneuraminic acid synthetase
MIKEYGFIIPAQESNQYSKHGDLSQFGGTTLVEWKISQIKSFRPEAKIYVTTPSEKIRKLFENKNIEVIIRPRDFAFPELVSHVADKIKEDYIIWSNPTSPFISEMDYMNMLSTYEGLNGEDLDSLVSGMSYIEYSFFKNQALNFNLDEFITRNDIEPVFVATNGCYIRKRMDVLKDGLLFGKRPFCYALSELSSKEIKDLNDVVMCNDMITIYMKNKP